MFERLLSTSMYHQKEICLEACRSAWNISYRSFPSPILICFWADKRHERRARSWQRHCSPSFHARDCIHVCLCSATIAEVCVDLILLFSHGARVYLQDNVCERQLLPDFVADFAAAGLGNVSSCFPCQATSQCNGFFLALALLGQAKGGTHKICWREKIRREKSFGEKKCLARKSFRRLVHRTALQKPSQPTSAGEGGRDKIDTLKTS